MTLTKKKEKMDILHGSIWNKLPMYALPVAATGILEQCSMHRMSLRAKAQAGKDVKEPHYMRYIPIVMIVTTFVLGFFS